MAGIIKKITHDPIAKVLLTLLGIVALLHVVAVVAGQTAPDSWIGAQSGYFDLDTEDNVPTVYNALLWGTTAFMALLLAVRRQSRTARFRWTFLSALFFYFSFDELLSLHERVAEPIRHALAIGNDSILYHAWIIPAAIVALGIGLMYRSARGAGGAHKNQRVVLKLLLILAVGVIAFEAIGTQLYFSGVVYKLGPVMLEELFEIGMASLILLRITDEVLNPGKSRK